MRNRANEFISKIKETKEEEPAETKVVEKRAYATHEPVHKSLEEAMCAAVACSKRLPTTAGAKGCRACAGEFFERIRQRKARGM